MRRWEELTSEFEALGVAFVAISPDTPGEVARFTAKHKLRMRVLSDADLSVTDSYNLRNRATVAMGWGRTGIRDLAIPTTILVDRHGTVRWIDQADDYRVRSDASRVVAAVRAALAEGTEA